jgi:hypothetical protein
MIASPGFASVAPSCAGRRELALPLLDAMVPALTAAARRRAGAPFGVVYVPNGIAMDRWTPTAGGGIRAHPDPAPLAPSGIGWWSCPAWTEQRAKDPTRVPRRDS